MMNNQSQQDLAADSLHSSTASDDLRYQLETCLRSLFKPDTEPYEYRKMRNSFNLTLADQAAFASATRGEYGFTPIIAKLESIERELRSIKLGKTHSAKYGNVLNKGATFLRMFGADIIPNNHTLTDVATDALVLVRLDKNMHSPEHKAVLLSLSRHWFDDEGTYTFQLDNGKLVVLTADMPYLEGDPPPFARAFQTPSVFDILNMSAARSSSNTTNINPFNVFVDSPTKAGHHQRATSFPVFHR